MKKPQWVAVIGTAVATLVAGLLGATASTAQAEGAHYYILVGGTCDGAGNVYNDAWLRGGIRRVVHYPAGAAGLPGCDQTPMDQSVARGHEEGNRVVQSAFAENPGAEFTVVGYSQGAIVANLVLNDIADGKLGVDKSRFTAKIFADPMQPVGPPGRGISAVLPAGMGAPSPFGGYVSFGPGRPNFGGIPFIRYCIETDGVCHFDTLEAPGGYFAQHQCYQWTRPTDGRSIMGDTIADGVYTNASQPLPRQNCRPPWPSA
ncbi:PE-PPE domain-containing protein [Amycolatopsis sp. NPDC059027]|uniref:PE-PPE domain-containing protein n=1 Tax=Amycolatopsis sp. NPDC059027 TaxID=3346709 RepID=UPI00366CA0A9